MNPPDDSLPKNSGKIFRGKNALPLLLALACGSPEREECHISCGVRLLGDLPNDCADASRAVDISLYFLREETPGLDRNALCARLEGYDLLHYERAWIDPQGRDVVGLTYCREKRIEVAPADWSRSSILHEIYHVYQDCDAQAPPECRPPDCDDAHWNWEQLGVYRAVEDYKRAWPWIPVRP